MSSPEDLQLYKQKTIQRWAKMLDKRKYGQELSYQEEEALRQDGLVAVYGFGDDSIEFHGAIHDDCDCDKCDRIYVNRNGVSRVRNLNDSYIDVLWCSPDSISLWSYRTNIPRQSFRIYDNNSLLYCVGFVFSIDDI